MLDQDTARALVTIADEAGARVALVGDRHQLPAVGRGGVLDLAHRWADPSARVDLDTVHRFVHTVDGRTVPDTEYAQLSLAMRAGETPAAVFDALHARGQIAAARQRDGAAGRAGRTGRRRAAVRRHPGGGGRHPRARRHVQRRDPRPARRRRRRRRPPCRR